MEKYNSNNFREFLINEKYIPLKNIRFYQVWVDKFLSYYQNNLKAVNYNDIKQFLDELESEGKEDWQIRQAYKAIKVFLEDFMCLLIDFTEDSKNGSTCKPVKKPKTWKEGFSKFINEIRFQHLAYNTEKTYRSWIRRFIEFKIIEEEPIEKTTKQEKLAKLFRSDIKTVILNPLDLDYYGKRKYYQELAAPIKGQLKKASKQLKTSAVEVNAQVKIAIIMNNGLTMTTPDEFQRLAIERTKNDTSGIDILIICGMYYFSDRFDSYAFFEFKDFQIQGEERPALIEKLRNAWFKKVEQYMTKQIVDLNMKRTKEPYNLYVARNIHDQAESHTE
jgi:hypothetical protein